MSRKRSTGGRGIAIAVLLVSLVAAGGFTFFIYRMLQGYQEELVKLQQEDVLRDVVVAKRTLHQGNTLIAEDLDLVQYPPAFVPDTTFSLREDVIGRVPRERILAGEFIREERLADPESGVGLNAIIPRGMRALSINITDGSAVSGFLNPGNYVDVLVTIQGSEKEEKTVTLMQACYVLAVDNRMGGGTGNLAGRAEGSGRQRPSVTLAVTPEQAEKLAHSAIQGDVTLTLRNDIDVTQVETHGATAQKLIGVEGHTNIPMSQVTERARTAPSGAPTTPTGGKIKEIRGGKTSEKQR